MFSPTTSTFTESDLVDVPTADLLNVINPELIPYLKYNTPQVYSALLAQDRTISNNLPAPHITAAFSNVIDPNPPPAPQTAPALSPAQIPFTTTSSPLTLHHPVHPATSVSTHAPAPTPNLAPQVPLTLRRRVPPGNPVPASVHSANPSSNPALMAVLGQARAMSNANPLNQQVPLPRPYFPPHASLASARQSPLATSNTSAAVAAVAGAAAAAAAAANSLPLVHPQYASLAMQHTRFPPRTPAAVLQNVPCVQSRVPALQSARIMSLPASRPVVPSAAVPAASVQPQPPPPRTVNRKRPNAAVSTIADLVPQVPPPVQENRLSSEARLTSNHIAAASMDSGSIVHHLVPVVSASGGPAAAKHANVVTNVDSMPVQLKLEQDEQLTAPLPASSSQKPDAPENVEVKKAMRAERNRQSAAASRERKKQHIKELERRVEMLSRENAMMQLSQLRTVRQRIELESKILHQMKELKRKVVDRDMQIHKLSRQLKDAKIKSGQDEDGSDIPRPSTWDAAEWRKKNRRSRGRA